MKFTRFSARGLNETISPNITFDNTLNFLVGINGCGKTTTLRAITALLTPDLPWLVTATFERAEVHFDIGDQSGIVVAIKTKSDLSLSLNIDGNVVADDKISLEELSNLNRARMDYAYNDEGQEIHLIEYVAQVGARYEVVNKIRELPSPIYLGLDRTTLPSLPSPREMRSRVAHSRRPRVTLRTFLDDSVAQAEELVLEAFNSATRRRAEETLKLREETLLSIFASGEDDIDSRNQLPRKEDLKRYENYRQASISAYKLAGINETVVSKNVDKFFDNLIQQAERLVGFKNVDEAIRSSPDAFDQFLQWNELRRKLSTVSYIEKKVSAYTKAETAIFSQIENYKEILNSFFIDSGKRVALDERGRPEIHLRGRGIVSSFDLSSGERQLFVLISNLMFNRDRKQARVLIIDEPELSLHLKWQEMFVDAMLRANPEAQLILATHSHSIILDHEEFCVSMDRE